MTDPYRPPSADLRSERDRLSTVGAAFRAALAGFGVDFVGTQLAFEAAAFAIGPRLIAGDPASAEFGLALMQEPAFYWPLFAVGTALVVAAGYVAARWVGERPVLFGGVAGMASLLPALAIFAVVGLPETAAPRWLDVASVVLHVPIACLGGWLARGRAA